MMHDDDRGVDHSIELLPIDPIEERQTPGSRKVIFLVIAGAILLSLATVFAGAVKIRAMIRARNATVSATAQRDPASSRAEAVAVFGKFDAVEQTRAVLSPELKREEDGILDLCRQLESCAANNDRDEFQKLVDFDRLVKRIELTGNIRQWTGLDKRYLKTGLKKSMDVVPEWGKIIVAGIVAPDDDQASRIVYAFGWNTATNDQTENRFWISREGDHWNLYDWERLDLGLSESREWGIYCKYANTPQMDGYHRWGELIGEADALTAKDDFEAAKEKLRLAESQPMPAELQDFHWLLTGHRWRALNETAEADKCYRNLKSPEETPGVYYSLMDINLWRNPSEALKYAQMYEAQVGPSPGLLDTKAMLLERLNRDREAAEEWKKLLRMQPDNVRALAQHYLSLPKDDKAAFEKQLARLEDPLAAAVSVATSIGYREYDGLPFLVDFLRRQAPGSPEMLYVTGFAQDLDGRYQEAAEHYRRAYEAEANEEKRGQYQNDYVRAMAADGAILEAWKTMPEPMEAFQSLFYDHEEDGVTLSDEEYRQIVSLYRARYPDDPDGMQREADLAVKEERYEEAAVLLRQAFERSAAAEPDDQSLYYRESCANSLATVLSKLHRLKEAYENTGERKQRFSQLARAAIAEERWDEARALIEMHRTSYPDDVTIHAIEGDLAAHDKRWDDAIRHFRLSAEAASESEVQRMNQRLAEVYVESDRSLEFYNNQKDKSAAFDDLASKLEADENWNALRTLIIEHRRNSPRDPVIAKHECEAAWEQENFPVYATFAKEALEGKQADGIAAFQRYLMEDRLLRALLRSRQFEQALVVAESKMQERNDPTALAIVHAARGNLSEAKRFAREAATFNDGGSAIYSNQEVGSIFLSDEFSELHSEFPVDLPPAAAPTLAILLSDKKWELEATDISAALQRLGIKTTAMPQPLEAFGKNINRAFALRFDQGSVWLVVGGGRFDDKWKLDGNNLELADTIKGSPSWLAVGTAMWTEPHRKQIEKFARYLSGELAGQQATVICATGHEAWQGFTAYPAVAELKHAWQSTGKLREFNQHGVQLMPIAQKSNVGANRQFDRSLRDAVRTFESLPGTKLEVWSGLGHEPTVDQIQLQVASVQRAHANLQFHGTLASGSQLMPELRAGLRMRFDEHEIQAWRLNDGDLMFRP